MANIVNVTFPIITLSTRVYKGSPPECVVMNTKNLAVSEYLNYGFNSMTRFNGVDLICDQNGIYERDSSELDNGTYKIKSHIKTGIIDTYTSQINRMRDSYLLYKSDGNIQLVTRADKKATRKYELISGVNANRINRKRIKFERGIKNRFFDFKIQNIDGSQLEINKLTVTLEPIVTKRR
jgi:hypothetical protein